MSKRVALRKGIANLALSLSADYGVFSDAGLTASGNGEYVQEWSGVNNIVARQLTELRKPLLRTTGMNGRPCLEFSSDFLVTDNFITSAFDEALTVFYVQQSIDGGFVFAINDTSFTTRQNCRYQHQLQVTQLGAPAAYNDGVQNVSGGLRVVGISYDGATLRTIANGQMIERSRNGTLNLSGAVTIGRLGSIEAYFAGKLSEIKVWRAGASAAELRSECSALMARWGIGRPVQRVICTVGDSLTYDYGDPSSVWTGMLCDQIGDDVVAMQTWAVPGSSLPAMISGASALCDLYLDNQTQKINIIFGGSNDVATGSSASTVLARMEAYCNERRAAGWNTIVVVTMLPRSAVSDDPNTETVRQEYNALLRSEYGDFADALADVAADNRIGDAGDELDTEYFNADRVHLVANGHVVVADIVYNTVSALI